MNPAIRALVNLMRRASTPFSGRTLLAAVGLGLLLWQGACVPAGAGPSAPDGTPPSGLAGSGGRNRAEHADAPHVVLVSLDGFRPDYIDRFDLPNVRRAAARGARARWMNPVFPSLTFPNHLSLVTGLYPESHGIVGNSFYDPARDATYSLSTPATVVDGTWYRGEPIWVTAERQGMVAACYFWPGSEATIRGLRPSIATKFDAAVPNDARVATVLDWLAWPDDRRPHFVTLYFSELDAASHRHPLDAPEVEAAAQSLDRSLGRLMDGIDALPIRDRVYVILSSDHGMVETSRSQTIALETLIDTAGVRVGSSGPVTSLHVGGEGVRARQLRDRLNAQLQRGRAWLRQDLPERYRHRGDPRAGDVVVVMDESWMLHAGPDRRGERYGMHGWDPDLPSMKALFLVTGPGIRAGAIVPPVENVDVYSFMTELLGLRPAARVEGRPGAIARQVMAKSTTR